MCNSLTEVSRELHISHTKNLIKKKTPEIKEN